MKKKIKKITSMLLVLVTSLSFSIPSFAATNSTDYTYNDYMEVAEKLTPYIAKNTNGTLYIEEGYKSIDIDSDDFDAISDNLKMVNSMISNGYLVSDAHGNITITDKYISKAQANTNSTDKVIATKNRLSVSTNSLSTNSFMASKASTKNKTDIVWQWYGFDLYLNNTLSNKVVGGLTVAASLATLIPDPVMCKAVAISIGVSAGLIALNNNGYGVIIKFETVYNPAGVPVPVPIWIKAQ